MPILDDPTIRKDPPVGDMLKSTYDADENDVVDNSEKLETSSKAQVRANIDAAKLGGSSKTQVQDHTPKAHTLDSHSEKKLDQLDEKTDDAGVTVDECLIKDGVAANSKKLEGSSKAEVRANIDAAKLGGSSKSQVQDHDPKSHTHSVGFTIAIPIDTPETVGTDKGVFHFAPGVAGTIEEVYLMAKTAPGAGKTLTVDVNKGGPTIFTTQDSRPSLSDTNTEATSGTPDVTNFAKNDIFTIDVDVSTAGASVEDVIVLIRGTQRVS